MKSKTFALIALLILGAALSARAAEVYVPHITAGDSNWTDLLIIDNSNSTSENCTVTFYDQGRILGNSTFEVDQYSHKIVDLKSVQPNATCAVITYTSNVLNFRLSYDYIPTGAMTEFNLPNKDGSLTTLPAFRNMRFLFPKYNSDVEWSGIAVMNTTDTIAYVTVTALGNKQMLANCTDSIPAKGRLVGQYSSWFPDVKFSKIDKVVINSDAANLNGITISGDTSNTFLLFTPGAAY